MLEIVTGELLPDQRVLVLQAQPSAKRWQRKEITRREALKLWGKKRQEGWEPGEPQCGALVLGSRGWSLMRQG